MSEEDKFREVSEAQFMNALEKSLVYYYNEFLEARQAVVDVMRFQNLGYVIHYYRSETDNEVSWTYKAVPKGKMGF